MKIVVLIDIDSEKHGDDRYTPLIAELLRMHAADMERTCGALNIKTVMDTHVVTSARLDAEHYITATEHANSPAGRAFGLPRGKHEQVVKIP